MPKILVCETLLKPQEIPFVSSTTEEVWTVFGATLFSDSFCDCPGFRFRETCKHLKQADAERCTWHAVYPSHPIERCPNCHNPVVEFEMDPEL